MKQNDGVLSAEAASAEVATALEIELGGPVSLMRRLAMISGDVPIDWPQEYVRADASRNGMRLVVEGPLQELVGGIGHPMAEAD